MRCKLINGSNRRPGSVMRWRKSLFIVVVAAAMAFPEAAGAQFSPRGIVGAMTRPLRAMLGHLGHFPRARRPHMAQESRAPGQQPHLANVELTDWPSAYEDVLGYVFWPGDYASQVRAHGFDVVAAAIIGPARGRELARVATTGSVPTDNRGTQTCDQSADVQVPWPISQLEQAPKLNGAQRDALGKLRTALTESIKTVSADCRDLTALPPLDRIKSTVQELWAVRDAGIYIRAPIRAFYGSLTDDQKAGFAWKQPKEPKPDGKAADSGMARQYQACASPGVESSERMLKEIEEKVRPDKQQAESLEALRKTSTDMTKLLSASCAQPVPANPLARLDAANDQLSSLSLAATSVELALNGFYAQLDDEQKARFELAGALTDTLDLALAAGCD